MNFSDTLLLALRNLRQAKLRAGLTIAGVVIGVMSIVCMVSFAIGLQENLLNRSLAKLDIFTTIPVSGASVSMLLDLENGRPAPDNSAVQPGSTEKTATKASRTTPPRRALDDKAIAEIEQIPGVEYVIPRVSFSSFVQYEGKTRQTNLSGAPIDAARIPGAKKILAGKPFSNDFAPEVLVSEDFTRLFGKGGAGQPPNSPFGPRPPVLSEAERVKRAEKLIGQEIVLLTLHGGDATPGPAAAGGEANPASAPAETKFDRHPFHIVGVIANDAGGGLFERMITGSPELIVPMGQARLFRKTNSDQMTRLASAMIGGTGYPAAVVHVADPSQTQRVYEKINELGLHAVSLTNQLGEVKRVFFIIDATLALLGGISLLVAALGISNTLIMSITERTREIGIMKAIGGEDREIMSIFFCEAGLLGFLGGALGVAAGWVVDRGADAVVNHYVAGNAGVDVEFFSIPWYLWTGAIAFAISISLLAALYPAYRAARVDPIRALRHD